MKKLLDFFRNLFKKKERNIIHVNKSIPPEKCSVALVIGHNVKDRGAVNFKGVSEYEFNYDIALLVQEIMIKEFNISIPVIERPNRSIYSEQCKIVASQLKSFEVTKAIELHFNSAEVNAYGAEVLVHNARKRSFFKVADHFLRRLCYGLDLSSRGVKDLYQGSHGYTMLDEALKVGVDMMIVEPCFGNHSHDEAHYIFDNPIGYAKQLSASILHIHKEQGLN